MSAARDYLAAVQQRADAATDGPWKAYDSNEETDYLPLWSVANDAFHNPPADEGAPWVAVDVQVGHRADAEFIAAARTDVPRLVAALTAVLDLHRPLPSSVSALYPEPLCECGATDPCPTVDAITDHLRSDRVGAGVDGPANVL